MAVDGFGVPTGQGPTTGGAGEGAFDWITSFGKSALETFPELIGITPSQETLQFRQDYPLSGIASELPGFIIPYMGWFKAAKYVPKLPAAVEAVGKLVTSPYAKGALQTGVELAPFEAGRLGVSQVVGDQPFGAMLGDTGINLALGAGIGGLIHGVAAAGVRDPKLTTTFPGLDISLPLPLMARRMREIMDSGVIQGPENIGRATGKLNDTLNLARMETIPTGEKYVAPIAHDPALPDMNTGEIEKQLNRLFKPRPPSEDAALQVRRFGQSGTDFEDAVAWQKAAEEAALPKGFEEHGQFFRHVSFNGEHESADKIAQEINQRITKNMTKVSHQDFITREADDGMFIIARKTNGSFAKPDAEDTWTIFKTDRPGMFLPEEDRWAKAMVAMNKWVPTADVAADGGFVYNALRNYSVEFSPSNVRMLERTPGGPAKVIDKLLPQNVRGPANESVARLGEAIKEHVAPTSYQFKKSPRANWIVRATKAAYDAGETLVNELMDGIVKVDKGKNLFFQSLRNDKSAALGFDPVREMPKIVADNFEKEFPKIWNARLDPTALDTLMTSGEISPETAKYFKNLDAVNKFVEENVHKAEEAVGKKATEFPPNQYGLPRIWEGDTRIIITDSGGKIVALGAGPTRKAAVASAQDLVKKNPGWKITDEFSYSKVVSDLGYTKYPKDLDPIIHSPSWMLEKQDLRGFKYDTRPPTAKEFLKDYEDALRGKMKYQANISVADQLAPQLSRLNSEDASAFRQVGARMNDYAGVQSAFSKLQNRAVDRILAPMIGSNSASKIVEVTSTALFNFQLGAGRLAYPVINALQFVQTVMPEVAFLMGKAPAEAHQGMYSYFAAGGTKGPVGSLAVLSPIKMMYRSMKEMAHPSAEMTEIMQRAVNDRVIDPRVVENYVGSSRITLGKAFKGEGNFLEWLRAFSEYLPAQSERLSRAHALTTGYVLARDFLSQGGTKLSSEQMYRFAREFTEKTMYLYSAADKPRIFTTPIGSAMGLFKNWMFNYMASMGEYTAEGFLRNNWSPLMWQTGGTFALGGLSATPLMFAADAASKWWTNKSALEMAYEQFGSGGDAVMLGLPAALTGISLYSGVNSPVSNPVRDAASLFSLTAWDRTKQIGKLAQAAFDNWQATGEHPGHNPGVRELLMRGFAPATLYRTMGALTPEQITQLGTGYPLVKDVPPMHRILYGMGFNPTELDRGMAISNELYEKKQRMLSQVKKLGDAWSDAEIAGNTAQMATIMRQAIVWGVDVGSVVRSGMNNLTKMREDIIERQLTPRMLPTVMNALRVQQGGM